MKCQSKKILEAELMSDPRQDETSPDFEVCDVISAITSNYDDVTGDGN